MKYNDSFNFFLFRNPNLTENSLFNFSDSLKHLKKLNSLSLNIEQ